MLYRYKMYRGPRPLNDPLPDGNRHDTRKHTKHCLRPTNEVVAEYLSHPTNEAWERFERKYLAILEQRFAEDPTPFGRLAELATKKDVHLGCSCPTKQNPDVYQCHTVLALQFMKEKFPDLDMVFPPNLQMPS